MVVVEERGNPAGLRQAPRERRRTWERGRAAPAHWYGCPPTPHIYIGARERGASPLRSHLRRGRRPRGVPCPPRQGGRPPLGFPQTLGAWALGGKAPSPLRGWSLSTYSP